MLIYGSRNSLIVVAVGGDNHPGRLVASVQLSRRARPVTFQESASPSPAKAVSALVDSPAKNHPIIFMEIV